MGYFTRYNPLSFNPTFLKNNPLNVLLFIFDTLEK